MLKIFSRELESMLGRFLVSRLGGVEFCVLIPGLSNGQAIQVIDSFKQHLAAKLIDVNEEEFIRLAFSAGITNIKYETLNEMMNQAGEYLLRAKDAGRNMVVGDD